MHDGRTYRERVKDFWDWFPTISNQLVEAMRGGNAREDLAFFVDQVKERIGGLAWVFGPGEAEDRISLTVSGEGQKARQILSNFWLQSAVDVEGWDFYASRQPSELDQLGSFEIQVGDHSVGAETLRLRLEIDEEEEQVDICAWHPAFELVDQNGRYQILFLLLDEALGEFGTQRKLGGIEFELLQQDEGISLMELPNHLDALWEEKQWSNLSPLESNTVYQLEPSNAFLRADTVAGGTVLPQMISSFLKTGGPVEDNPLSQTGAELVFLVLENGGLEHLEDALDRRNEVVDEIERNLAGGGGEVVGAALGTENAYVDLILFDGGRSLAAVKEAVEAKSQHDYRIEPFYQ